MRKAGMAMAGKIAGRKTQNAIAIALIGELGSGKTVFAQGFLEYFGVKKANSPTFVIMKKYICKNLQPKTYNLKFNSSVFHLYHIDCYRIGNSRDILELGFEEIIKNPRSIVLIEWADRIKDILPRDVVWIKFFHKSKNEREIEIDNWKY